MNACSSTTKLNSFHPDTPLTYDALNAPDLTYTLLRPLEEKYTALQQQGNKSVVFCLLLNRVHFLRDQNITTAPLSRTRASLCEILAIRVLRAHGTGDNTLQLTLALTTMWPVYAGADTETMAMVREERADDDDRVGNAIEVSAFPGLILPCSNKGVSLLSLVEQSHSLRVKPAKGLSKAFGGMDI